MKHIPSSKRIIFLFFLSNVPAGSAVKFSAVLLNKLLSFLPTLLDVLTKIVINLSKMFFGALHFDTYMQLFCAMLSCFLINVGFIAYSSVFKNHLLFG